MNNKSIEKTSITRRTHRFIYMLTGILLLLSCGSDNNNPTEDPGNTTNYYLQLQPNGLNAIRVSCTEENFVFPFQIKVIGNGTNKGFKAQINPWSEDELKAYNNKVENFLCTFALIVVFSDFYRTGFQRRSFNYGC